MSDYYPKRPRIKFAEVREYRAANGNNYFSFFLGRTKAILFKDKDAEPVGNSIASWTLFLEETDPARPKPQQAAPAQRGPATGQYRPAAGPARTAMDARAEASLRERGIAPNSPVSEDDLPF
jgi:hypothetical protein